jgi:cytochrome c553
MPAEHRPAWQRLLAAVTLIAGLGVLAVALFIWSGVYPVGADREHLGITTWLLTQVRERSVATYSSTVEVRPVHDPDMARLGAAHFEGGCVPCHARPGEPVNAIVSGMLPPPPDLAAALAKREALEEIFWIVMNGLKYTGMPAWPSQLRNDEVWAVTAFLDRLRETGPAGMNAYPSMAGIDRLENPPPGGRPAAEARQPLTECRRCHDDSGLPTLSALVPNLAGQSETYLRRALHEYFGRRRPSGIMQPVAGALSSAGMERLAAYYAALPPPPGTAADAKAQERLRGQDLARQGDPDRDVPPCLACHGDGRAPSFPSLAGQHASYLLSQLELWQRGGRASTAHGRIMAAIARRLTAGQMRDAAAFFSSEERQPLGGRATAAGGQP